jgi:hypothetical protein
MPKCNDLYTLLGAVKKTINVLIVVNWIMTTNMKWIKAISQMF